MKGRGAKVEAGVATACLGKTSLFLYGDDVSVAAKGFPRLSHFFLGRIQCECNIAPAFY